MGAGTMNLLQARGAQPATPSRYKPVWTDRFFQGYYTNRNPFRSPLSAFYAEGWGLGKTDALIEGANIELSPRLTLARRPGFLLYSSAIIPYQVTGFYGFRQYKAIPNPTDLIIDTTNGPYKLTQSAATSIFVKAAGAGITRFLGLGNTLYMADGVDLLAWQDGAPAPNPRNWGISIGPFAGVSGPNYATTGTDVSVSGGSAWTNPANVTVAGVVNTSGTGVAWVSGSKFTTGTAWNGNPIVIGGTIYTVSSVTSATALVLGGSAGTQSGATYAAPAIGSVGAAGAGNTGAVTPGTMAGLGFGLPVAFAVGAGGTTQSLVATNLGLSVPGGAVILGVKVSTTRQQLSGTSAFYTVQMYLQGVSSIQKYDAYGSGYWTGSATAVNYGGASDTWGAPLTAAIVNSSAFGVTLEVNATGAPGNGGTGQITALTITVYYATSASTVSDYLEAQAYAFNFTSSSTTTIGGILVTIPGYQSAGNPGSLNVQLLQAGAPVGTPKTGIVLGTTYGSITLGGSADMWGTTLGAPDVGASTFGVAIQAVNSAGGSAVWYIGPVEVSVSATGGPPITVLSGSGTFSATVGYEYCAAYGNSSSGGVSTATPPSAGTGIFTNVPGVQVSLTASTDPQVNQIWVFRTTDGGANFYALPTSPYPNTTGNITDSAADSALNILLPAPINHSNDPPPAGATAPVYHMGRVWVAVGNVLYASGGPDTITGNGAEAFPPLNYWTLPSTITRMVPTASGLVLFMVDRVEMIAGGPSILQFYVQPLISGMGLLSYDALDIYGSQAFLFTADRQFLSFDMNSGLSELGFPIEDRLRQLSPTQVSIAYHTTGLDRGVFLCDGTATWYRCAPQQPPDYAITGPVWSPPGTIASGSTALMKSIETSDGLRQLLVADGATVLYRDSTYSIFKDNGTAYPAHFTVGSIVLANPGQLAELGFITADFVRTGTSPSISVLLDEISGNFSALPTSISDPPKLYGVAGAPSTLYSNRYYFRQSTSGGGTCEPVWCRHMQINVDFGSDTVQNEILSNTIWGTILEEGAG